MRVLRVVNSNDGGGVFTCEKQFIEELKNRDIVVDAVILGDGLRVDEYTSLCNITYRIPALEASYGGAILKILFSIFQTLFFGSKYSRILEKQIDDAIKYDAIIYQRPVFIHLVGKLSNRLKAKALWHLPNVARTSFSKNYYNYFCRKYNIIQVANSHFTKSTLGVQCRYVVYPGFDEKRVSKSAPIFRNQLKLSAGTPVYGIAARMHEDKAQDLVVEAFVNSKVSAYGGHLLVAGGPLDSDYAQRVKEKAGPLLSKQIHFLGEISSMSEFYSSVDVVINGRRNVEPFGITIAEAMGAGKPVIAYKLGGPSEMIINSVNGWLVDSSTTKSYEDAFNLSITDKSKWLEMGQFAKENSYKFSVKENVSTLISIIKNH
ncbi:glycosyltransferase family 4 protein [Pontibacter sp. 172403-2]|uniref:glycosyltransferase family 4 protein n=1 Tax=Pontibacter rufus TaxID=2791028 RepID=UPI0018AFA316|nr:glycosyltransferase family 4 protein [Pontibacter sp. 172403-2]MBF9252538.1 glycosyltransferase family 4 protein [Pontibacter sp. 172403-2]